MSEQQQQQQQQFIFPQPYNDKKITLKCTGCGIEIIRYKKIYEKNKTKTFYHNRACFMKDHTIKGSHGGRPEKKVNLTCAGCGIAFSITVGLYNARGQTNFYHNQECYYDHVRAESKKNNYVDVTCAGCGIQFTIYKCQFRQSKTRVFYHTRQCFIQNNQHFRSNPNRKCIYIENYRCTQCMQYVKKSDVKMHTTPAGTTYPICPNPICGKYRLQMKPRSRKHRLKLKKDIENINK